MLRSVNSRRLLSDFIFNIFLFLQLGKFLTTYPLENRYANLRIKNSNKKNFIKISLKKVHEFWSFLFLNFRYCRFQYRCINLHESNTLVSRRHRFLLLNFPIFFGFLNKLLTATTTDRQK